MGDLGGMMQISGMILLLVSLVQLVVAVVSFIVAVSAYLDIKKIRTGCEYTGFKKSIYHCGQWVIDALNKLG